MPPSRAPTVLKGSLGRLGEDGAPAEIVAFQYNPTELFRRIESRGGEPGAPPKEMITCTLSLDASDALELPDENPEVVEYGIQPMLAALELLMYAPDLSRRRRLPLGGRRKRPKPTPIALFIWGTKRTLPVRLERLDILEILHDPSLRPIRASVTATMCVVTDHDVPKGHPAAKVWRQHLEITRSLGDYAGGGAPLARAKS